MQIQIPLSISPQNLVQDTNIVLSRLFPNIPSSSINLKEEKSGLTNKLVKATIPATSGRKRVLLVRTYGEGSDTFISRKQEIETINRLSNLGFCPNVVATFQNGMVYGYIPGKVFSARDMSDEHKSCLVSREIATWHQIPLDKNASPSLFPTLYQWIDLLPENAFLNGWDKEMLRAETSGLEDILTSIYDSPVVFCHNDLQCGNIILQDNDKVKFIDFEYGAPNYRGFDIGNHFNEFGGLEGKWSLYPSKEVRMKWLRKYLQCFNNDQDPSECLVEALEREVLAFSLASHLFWAVWSLLQASHSSIDFDYIGYGEGRLKEYLDRKPEWLD